MMLDNVFAQIPDAHGGEIFEPLVRTNHTHVERIISQGQATAPGEWYDQPRAEWVLLLQGEATIRYASGEVFSLQPGDWLNIPPHCRHRVDRTSPTEITLWLAIHYD